MSTFKVEVVDVTNKIKHPNADLLSIVYVFDYPVIVRTSDFDGCFLGAYIPVDSLVPDNPEFAFLEGHLRIKAKKIRSIFSQGILLPAQTHWRLGDDVTLELGITKYEPVEKVDLRSIAAPRPPGFTVEYTEIEQLRRYSHVFEEGENVAVTSKTHGTNCRITLREGVLHVGSHHQWKKQVDLSPWWMVVTPELKSFMELLPSDAILFGEVYGAVQDLHYGLNGVDFVLFDVYNVHTGLYLDWPELKETCSIAAKFGIKSVPILYEGEWHRQIVDKLIEEDDVLGGKGHICEGAVIRPVKERFDPVIGRVILKLISQRYLLRAQ